MSNQTRPIDQYKFHEYFNKGVIKKDYVGITRPIEIIMDNRIERSYTVPLFENIVFHVHLSLWLNLVLTDTFL